MIENKIKGSILNISSSSALRPARSAYVVSKWGVRGLTEGMAQKLAPYWITVNALAPGSTNTGMMVEHLTEGKVQAINSPTGRLISPKEIANIAVVLSSDLGKMIMGDTVYMTGGRLS